MNNMIVLGSTGSIGRQTLDVVENYLPQMKIKALSAFDEVELFAVQIQKFKPEFACMVDVASAAKLKLMLGEGSGCTVLAGQDGIKEIASMQVDVVLNAIVGFAGLNATLSAISVGNILALANKESLVAGGRIVMEAALRAGTKIIPVDSEHSAIFQCLQSGRELKKIILTASGGPFRGMQLQDIYNASANDALKHPNWSMGPKITIDSASMANKGLEIIEAKWLFNVDYKQIDVLIHPQSIVHSMVEYLDGSTIAQLGRPDMRVPILYALSGGTFRGDGPCSIDLSSIEKLTFTKPDYDCFPAVALAYRAGIAGGTYPTVFNAANEHAVHAFLLDGICFGQIAEIIDAVLEQYDGEFYDDLDGIIAADQWGRIKAAEFIQKIRTL